MSRTMPIASIVVGHRFRQDLGDLVSLAKSIKKIGLLNPITVSTDRKLLAGHRRLEACRDLGWTEIPVTITDIDALLAERDENEERKAFSPSEAVAIGRAIEEQERPKAKERQRAAGGDRGNQHCGGRQSSTGGSKKILEPPVTVKAASAVGMSQPTYDKAKAVVAAAEADPEAFGDLAQKMDQTGKVDPAFKEMKRRQQST